MRDKCCQADGSPTSGAQDSRLFPPAWQGRWGWGFSCSKVGHGLCSHVTCLDWDRGTDPGLVFGAATASGTAKPPLGLPSPVPRTRCQCSGFHTSSLSHPDAPGCRSRGRATRSQLKPQGQMRDGSGTRGSSPVQHRLLRGQVEEGVSAGRAEPEPPARAGVSRAGGSEGHRPRDPPGARQEPGLQVTPRSVVCTLTLLLLHSNI